MWHRIIAIVLVLGLTTIRVSAAVVVRLTDKEDIDSIVEIDGNTWIASKTGAYRVNNNTVTKIFDEARVISIVEVEDNVWLGTPVGLYGSTDDGRQWSLVTGSPVAAITTLVPRAQEIWVGTDGNGAYRYADGVFESLLPRETIFSIRIVEDQLWLLSNRNAYQLTDGKAVSIFAEPKSVHQVESVSGEIWFLTREPIHLFGLVYECYRLAADGSPERVLEAYEVTTLKEVADELWFGTMNGSVFRIDAGTQRLVTKGDFFVNTIATDNHGVWLGTTQGSYLLKDGVFSPIPLFRHGLNVLQFSQSVGHTWVGSSLGAYRFDEDVEVFFRPGSRFSLHVFDHEIFFGKKTGVKEIRYDRGGEEPYGGSIPSSFEVVINRDSGAVQRDMRLKESMPFSPTRSYQAEVSGGYSLLYAGARDGFGNSFDFGPINVYSVGPWAIFWVLVSLFSLAGFVNIVFIPRSERSANAISSLLNLTGAGIESKALISAYQAVSAIRSRTLRSYFEDIKKRDDFLAFNSQYRRHPAGSRADHFLDRLHDDKVLSLYDSSGEGEQYLKYLTWGIADARGDTRPECRVVPVFVDFDLYQGGMIIEGVFTQLERLGGIPKTTARCLLKHEVFVFLIDATGHLLDRNRRKELIRFIEKYSAGNRMVICCSEQYGELKEYASAKLELIREDNDAS